MTIPLAAILGLAFYASEWLLTRRRHSSLVAGGKSVDGGTLRVLHLVIGLSIAAGVVAALYLPGPRLPPGMPWRAVSLTIFALGMAFRWWAVIHLGRFFTVDVAVVDDQRVIDTGPYRAVRHPSYTGSLMEFMGWALSLGSVVAVPLVMVPIFCAFLYRIRVEEAALRDALGESYVAYSRRTKRLVPMVY